MTKPASQNPFTFICRPTRKSVRKPDAASVPSTTAWPLVDQQEYRCAGPGCEASVLLGEIDPLPAGWCTQTPVGLKGAGQTIYFCPLCSPLRPRRMGGRKERRRQS